MILAFDLDDCICKRPKDKEHLGADKYKYCTPIDSMIEIVNQSNILHTHDSLAYVQG